ncbi:hypothetical protein L1987_10397 [Smallanthus sonchifolius]|uniref:Uncharacterized protein n=1 Tax=Smallanthus sonchifolius TaxID=185202 RepID=A0ACB9JSC8_9ASTR|nr:hypothetical protein L1987_10397 [Smallanthus sonchifolius]
MKDSGSSKNRFGGIGQFVLNTPSSPEVFLCHVINVSQCSSVLPYLYSLSHSLTIEKTTTTFLHLKSKYKSRLHTRRRLFLSPPSPPSFLSLDRTFSSINPPISTSIEL